jgi:hypothetical protein
MISLSGLAQTYPGYEDAEKKTADTEKVHADAQAKQTAQRDAAIKMIGANVAGAALAGPGPQAPPPGQASMPARPPVPPPQAAPSPAPPQGGPPPSAPPAAAPSPPPAPGPAAGVSMKMPLQGAVQAILARSPQVANHPEILLAALNHFKDLGILDPEAEAKIDEAQKQHTLQRVATAKGHLQAVQGATPAAPAAPAAAPAPTATDPKTGAKVQWDGKSWQPMPS